MAQIVGNVALSVILAKTMGVRGIALATVLCKLFFVLFICAWFFSKRNSLKLVAPHTDRGTADPYPNTAVRGDTSAHNGK